MAPVPEPGLPAGGVGAGGEDRPAPRRPDRRAAGGAGRRRGRRDLALALARRGWSRRSPARPS